MQRGVYTINTKRGENSLVKTLILHLNKLEKEEKTKHRAIRKKEITKIGAEIIKQRIEK